MSAQISIQEIHEVLSVCELAKLLCLKPRTIYNKLEKIRRGQVTHDCLPPIFYRPGSNRPSFLNPSAWILAQFERQNETRIGAFAQISDPSLKKKRGRKTNKEKAALARGGEA